MSDGFAALFWGVITFSLLVVVHEGGHFLAARAFGVKVHEFMIGLPGPALRFHGRQTTYGITAVPLGGYVRIAGMEPGPEDPLLEPVLALVTKEGGANPDSVALALGIDAADADRALLTLVDWNAIEQSASDEYTYHSRFPSHLADDPAALLEAARSITYRSLPTWKRIVVLSMGVILNLLTAVLVFTIVISLYGTWSETGRVGAVSKGSAAAEAGIRPGDRIISVGGVNTPDFQRLVTAVSRFQGGDSVPVRFERDGRTYERTVIMGENEESGRALLGVSPDVRHVRPGPWNAFLLSFSYIGLTFIAIAGFFNPETFQASVSQSASIIRASMYAADAARSGPLDYAGIVAALSLSLGAINILPIPPLDGGKVAIEIVERLRGRPLPRDVSLGISVAGAIMLFALIGYLMYRDVATIANG